jgi:hypothetical protein
MSLEAKLSSGLSTKGDLQQALEMHKKTKRELEI